MSFPSLRNRLGVRRTSHAASPTSQNADAQAQLAPGAQAAMLRQMAERYPNILAIATSSAHDEGSVVGHGCDDQFEFEFALDLLLEGFERLHEQGWSSRRAKLERAQ
jgi:hypothetical protein